MTKILSIFNIKPGEGYLVTLYFLQAIFIGLPRLFTLTAANSLFIENYSANNLPYAYLFSSLLISIAGITYLYVEKRISYVKLQIRTLLALCLILCGFILLLWWLPNAKWLNFLLLIWFGVELMLTQLIYWNVANRLFTIRQSKRLFGLIWSGEILTFIVGGFLMPYLVQVMGTVNLLFLSLSGLVLALLNIIYMSHAFRFRFTDKNAKNDNTQYDTKSFLDLFKNRYIVFVFAFFAIYAYSVYVFIDNIFYIQLNQFYQNSEQLASFLGQFWAVYGIFSLVFRAFISGQWITRVGMLGGLLTSPITLLICAVSIIITGNILNNIGILFLLIVLTKQLEGVFADTVVYPAYHTLYHPLSPKHRVRVQAMIELVIGPMVGILTSMFLLLLNKIFEFTAIGLSVVLVVILLALGILCFPMIKEYQKMLATALSRKNLVGTELQLNDRENLQILEQSLKSHRPEEVLYCLKLLEEAKFSNYKNILFALLNHDHVEVRKGVYQSIEKLGEKDYFEPLKKQLAIEKIPSVQASLICALAASGGSEAISLIEPYLNDEQPVLRQAAIVALIRYCSLEGAVRAGSILLGLEHSSQASERQFMAQVLGQIGISNFYFGLLPLLSDTNIEVRKAALIAAGQLNNHKLWPLVIESLLLSAVRVTAAKVLLEAKESSFKALELAYQNKNSATLLRRQIILLYGKTRSNKASQLLLNKLNEPDKNLRHDILKSLYLCDYKTTTSKEKSLIETLIHEEVIYGLNVLAAQSVIEIKTEVSLLSSAFKWELDKLQARLFYLLSFLYSTEVIMKVWSNLKAQKVQHDLAIKLFEQTVTKKHQKLTLPILQSNIRISKDSLTLQQLVTGILFQPEKWNNTWFRICAIEMVVNRAMNEISLSRLVDDPDELVRETAQYYDFKRRNLSSKQRHYILPTIEKVKLLQCKSLFSKIPQEFLVELVQVLKEQFLPKDKILFRPGEPGNTMYIIVKGLVRLHQDGKTPVELGNGELFGELAVLTTENRTSSVTTIQECHLLYLSQNDLQTLMAEHIEIAKGIMQFLYHRLRTFPRHRTTKQSRIVKKNTRRFQFEEPLSLIEKVIVLKTVSIFSNVSNNILSEMAQLTQEVFLKPEQVLFKQGDLESNMYIIVEGFVKVYNQEQLIIELGERETIGEFTALFSEPQTVSVAAIEDTRLLSLSQEVILELTLDQHEVIQSIIQILVQHLCRLMK
jgi:CRP-like cAMP-binding protein/ATP/ADP translocase/HEAT repeat protein